MAILSLLHQFTSYPCRRDSSQFVLCQEYVPFSISAFFPTSLLSFKIFPIHFEFSSVLRLCYRLLTYNRHINYVICHLYVTLQTIASFHRYRFVHYYNFICILHFPLISCFRLYMKSTASSTALPRLSYFAYC